MGPFQDGWLSALAKIITAMLARSTDIDFRALYGGVVLFRDGDKVTVRPDDARLGASLVCQLCRPDGYSSIPTPGTQCLIGWDGYDPSERYAIMASTSGQAATSVSIQAATVNLGDELGQPLANASFVAAEATMIAAVVAYATAVAVVVPLTADAATALQTAFTAYGTAAATFETIKTKAS